MPEKALTAFTDTTATQKIFKLTKKIRAVSGGTSASKTISILVWIIDYAQNTKNKIVTIVGESVPHLNLGAKRDFKNIMVSNGYWEDSRWSESGVYKFKDGTVVEFISFDKFGKAHGPRRDVLFLNEANYLPYNIADQLITRTRNVVWMDWNPTIEFWFYTEFLNKRDIDFMGSGGNYPPLTYLDNEALDVDSVKEIEAHQYNATWWKVYGLGQLGELEGKIFKNWQFIDEIPHEARLERYGLDFGYTNDPTAIVAIYYYNGGYILDEILFQKGLSNKQIADTLLNVQKVLTIADSAEPKSIDEIRSFGVYIQATTKGPGSVLQRIQMAQAQQISVTNRSINLKKEYRNYLWVTDKDGRIVNEPDHLWSHSMDAFMYGMASLVPILRRREMAQNARPNTNVKRNIAV